jgi:hypothetical protein
LVSSVRAAQPAGRPRAGDASNTDGATADADDTAAETVGVLAGAQTWWLLTRSAGWDLDRYERWLTNTLVTVLAR